jgi:Ni2+-binding GTPase involved in maturation of urease and hydrogenase
MNSEDLKKHMATVAIHQDKLPEDLKTVIQNFFEIADFHINVYQSMADETREPLTRLAKEHYPELLTATHPLQIEYIEEVNTTTVFSLVNQMRGLVLDMKEGTDILVKYPKMEQGEIFISMKNQM